jgi:hypothetical protein
MEMNRDDEQKLCDWRDALINSKTPEPDTWYTHPIYKNYEANTNGDIRNKTRNTLIKGSINDVERTTISINTHKKQKHRFVMECLYGVEIPSGYDIDHVDQKPGNNKFVNLQILTRKEHCAKTAATNPGRGKKATINSSKPILCQKMDEKGECIEKKVFDSVYDASRKMNMTRRPIQASIKTNKPTKSGYIFSEILANDPDLDGERWLEYNNSNLWVSNKGRVWFQYLSVPYKTYGSKSIEGYHVVSHHGHAFKVHTLVALLFIGENPTVEHTIDHIDNDRGNNVPENLRWATKSEQALNRSSVKPIEVYNYLTGEVVGTFHSSKECCEKYEVHPMIVSNALGFGIDHFNRGRQLGKHKYLSVRHVDLTNEIKLNREISVLEHELTVLMKDKNKRKCNDEKLPVHITKTGATYVLTITFRGAKCRKCSNNVDSLLLEKETWINEQKKYYINLYRKLYC